MNTWSKSAVVRVSSVLTHPDLSLSEVGQQNTPKSASLTKASSLAPFSFSCVSWAGVAPEMPGGVALPHLKCLRCAVRLLSPASRSLRGRSVSPYLGTCLPAQLPLPSRAPLACRVACVTSGDGARWHSHAERICPARSTEENVLLTSDKFYKLGSQVWTTIKSGSLL